MGGTEDDKEGEEDVEMMWEVEDEEGGLVEVEMADESRRWGQRHGKPAYCHPGSPLARVAPLDPHPAI